MAAVDQDELEALEDLKQTNDLITTSLKNDLELVHSRHKNLIIDFDQQRAHLVESLLDRETLRKDLEAAKKARPTLLSPAEDLNTEGDAEEEKAALVLKEVSHEHRYPKEKSPKSVAKWVGKLLSPRPRNRPPKEKFPTEKEALHAAEVDQERKAIGFLQRDRLDDPSHNLDLPRLPLACHN